MDNRIREIRHEKGMTLKEVINSIDINISESHLSNIEVGRGGISIKLLVELSKLFNVSTDYILKRSNIKEIE